MNFRNHHDQSCYKQSCYKFLAKVFALLFLSMPSEAQEFFERFETWPSQLRTPGIILLAPSREPLIKHFENPIFDLSDRQLIVLDPLSGSGSPRKEVSPPHPSLPESLPESLLNRFAKVTFATIDTLMSPPANSTTQAISQHLWSKNSILLLIDDSLIPEAIPREQKKTLQSIIEQALQANATVAWAGPSCIAMGKYFFSSDSIAIDNPVNSISNPCEGLDCFLDAVFQISSSNAVQAVTKKADVKRSLDPSWKCVSVQLPPENVLVLTGRKMITYGPDPIVIEVPATEHLPGEQHSIVERNSQDIQALVPGRQRRQLTEEYLLDWTQWRRMAIERTLAPFPPPNRQTPLVENGTLIIIGGGATPRAAMNLFVQRAGGEKAKLVFVPCSESDDASNETDLLETWKRMGVESCHLIHTKDRNKANQDESFLAPLKEATGIWFGGGRQWNLADSYYGTQAHRLMKEVLARGGVIAGSSAGASIQAEYLARATPIDNFRIMAPGYERGGLGFLRGVAIDQHFTQRARQKDLQSLVEKYPQMLGIGIDESTAIVVEKSAAEILGKGQVTFYWMDSASPTENNEPTQTSDSASNPVVRQEFIGNSGDKFDLATRTPSLPAVPSP